MSYRVVETNEIVPSIRPDLRTRFRWRAERRAAKLNAMRIIPSYRWEIVRRGQRWSVEAFQNRAVSV